jgi:hypothetical protein
MNGTGEIGENAPSEANCDETMSTVEPQEAIRVTVNSGALPGLDNGAAQPGGGSAPEPGKAPGSGSASGNPQPPAPDRFERPGLRVSLPATVSKREKRQLRLEKERRTVERMVADKLLHRVVPSSA